MTDRVTEDQIDYVGKTSLCLLCYPYHKLLRLPRRCFCCASVFLSFPFALGRTLFSRTAVVLFCLPHLRGGTTPLGLFYFIMLFYFFMCFFVPFVLLSVNASGLLAFVCRTCRTQYDGT